jgi:hypothetical protein
MKSAESRAEATELRLEDGTSLIGRLQLETLNNDMQYQTRWMSNLYWLSYGWFIPVVVVESCVEIDGMSA